jgi:hypothetical protein
VLVVCEKVDVCGIDREQMAIELIFTQTCMTGIMICMVTRPPSTVAAGMMFLVGRNSEEPLRLADGLTGLT